MEMLQREKGRLEEICTGEKVRKVRKTTEARGRFCSVKEKAIWKEGDPAMSRPAETLGSKDAGRAPHWP